MQKFSIFLSLLLATCFVTSVAIAQTPAAQKPAAAATKTDYAPAAQTPSASGLTTQKEKFSYALGLNIGANLQKQSVPVDADLLARGVKDATSGGTPLLTEEEARAVLTEMQMEMRKQQQAKAQQLGEANKKEGTEFLAANKAKQGIVALPSGLQYKILTAGTGPKPAATDTVTVNYRGTLINGTEFDSSYKRGQPTSFPVNGVIKGWTEALQLMPVGSKWQLFIPSDLAYAERGSGANIGPNATLIFEVELLSIGEKTADKPELKK